MSGETPPVEPKQDTSEEQLENPWWLWLVLSLLVIAALFCVGQLALMTPAKIQAADTHSGLKADYSLWPSLSFKPLEEALVEDLISENPALPTQIVVSGNYWPTSSLPAGPTQTASATPTELPTATTALRPARLPATRVSRPPNTQEATVPTLAPSATRVVVTNTQAPTATNRPGNPYRTPTPAPTRTPTITLTYTPTATFTRTATASITPTKTLTRTLRPPSTSTSTPTSTGTATDTPTFTPTPTATDTRTSTPAPLPSGFNLGTPDAAYYNIACGSSLVIDLGSPAPYIGTLIFYEFRNPIPSACHGGVCLDQVVIDVSNSNGPQTTLLSLRIFYWGDADAANNGSIPLRYYPPEAHNAAIAGADLYNNQGIQIHVDGVYQYISVAPPLENCSDPAQVDSIEIWPATMTPTPTP